MAQCGLSVIAVVLVTSGREDQTHQCSHSQALDLKFPQMEYFSEKERHF